MEISVSNALKIFDEALKVLGEEIPESNKECEFCKWNQNH
tara:strand:+ start:604 stop:723 length:120 start_codon:yes stop_codon:yes gene_type:complete